jgi:hypothetical protein
MRFWFLTAASMRMIVFWDIALHKLQVNTFLTVDDISSVIIFVAIDLFLQ